MAIIPGLRVVRSSIDGYGVVVTRDFAEGEMIAEVEGVLWREGDAMDDRYSLLMGEGYFFDMVDQTRWINHSCQPNAEVEVGMSGAAGDADRAPWAHIYALRALKAGEELTYDYAFSADVAEPCRCGTSVCRGFIVDEDELHLLTTPSSAAAHG